MINTLPMLTDIMYTHTLSTLTNLFFKTTIDPV